MKYWKKTCAAVLSAAMILSLPVGTGKVSYAAENVEKEETVYVNLGEDGTVQDITVSDWLKNVSGNSDITDVSNLDEIKNVKGEEEFTKEGEGKLTWKANNADIYYQGKTDEALPVGVTVSYQLDGREIKPDELAGKSGKVTMTIRYENKEIFEKEIDGEKTQMNIPFLMASAIILPVDTFSNVTVSQGKMVSEGSNQIVVAYGMPGLSESLNLSKELNGELNEKISDTVTITADVNEFVLGSIYTVATSDEFADIELTEDSDINDVEAAINDLANATDELLAGSEKLSDGLTSLQDNFKTYAKGVDDVSDGAEDLSKGAGKLAEGVSKYTEGVKTITTGASQYVTGAQTLAAGVGSYIEGEKLIDAGTTELYNQTQAFPAQYGQFSEGLLQYINGVNGIAGSAGELSAGSKQLAEGMTKVNGGLEQLNASYANYSNVLSQMRSIADGLEDEELKQQLQAMIAALEEIVAAQQGNVGVLKSAASDLTAATEKMADGMAVLNGKAPELVAAGDTLKTYNTQIGNGISGVAGGISSLYEGVKTLSANNEALLNGAATLTTKGLDLTAGIDLLSDSTGTLTASAKKLSKGAGKLSDGASKLDGATKDVSDGVNKLQSGSLELFDGLNRFKSEGTGKLQLEYNQNIKTVIERFRSLTEGAQDYKTFSGIADGMDGKVKFIFQTAEISAEK
ncbi:MAG: hypothetical protein NC124_00205 [Clostridium sp.]|nr:hypothetical protein [Clostridium sp.]